MYSKPGIGAQTPDCVCGRGKMELHCAGRSAMNAGRYYYKCPINAKHSGSFKWCDEYHRDGRQVLTASEEEKGKQDRVVGCTQCCGHATPNHLTSQIVVGFMAVVLILLGILIGKVV
ncbi:hypothetical protein AAHA92_24910 [Salvia divinorum]|uniref:GRF-type domain-containing protein n=1 Tax=Salvia divinorum TaxID=28513 RepID=A0ABD1GA08_SALDI